MKNDFQLVEQFKKHRKQARAGLRAQYENTQVCQSFYAGDAMNYKDNVQFSTSAGNKKRAMVQFNRVKPYVNAVKGFMAQNRREAKYTARLENDQLRLLYSRYCNSLKNYIRDKANADQIETQADGDMLTVGYSAIETAMTYGDGYATNDPNGQIIMGRLDPMTVWWDSYSRETGVLDARFCGYDKKYNIQDALELFQDSKEEDFDMNDDSREDDGYVWFENGGKYNKIREDGIDWADTKAEIATISFYQWIEYETFYRADNPVYALKNPQAVQLAEMQLEALAQEFPEQTDVFGFDAKAAILTFDDKIKGQLLDHFGEYIEPFEHKRKVYYTAVVSGEHVFTKYRSPCQSGFTIKFKTGDFDAKNKIWTGMVNSMKEPITYYNKALTELMFIIGANSKGGVLVEESAVDDISDFEQKYAKTDSVIVVRDGAISGGKIRDKKTPFTPTGYENVIQLADASINDAVGIDKTFLGSSENKQETGLLQARRIRQVTASLACYMDSVTLYMKEHARLMLDFIRVYAENNDGAMFRITGDDGKDEFLKVAKDKLAEDYDVSIEEAPQSAEEKQEYATILNGIAEKLMSAGDAASAKAVFAVAIKNLPLDQMDIQKILQILAPKGDQVDPAYVQQLEAQVKALMSEVTQADVKKKLSEIAVNTAKLDDMAAKTHLTLAQAQKAEQEAVHTHFESALMQQGRMDKVDVTI
jgi:hypothetical protein